VDLLTEHKTEALSLPLIELLAYSLDHANIKSINIESFEGMCNVLMPLVLVAVCDE